MRELVILEIRELLEAYSYPDDLPVIKGSARCALEELEDSDMGMGSIRNLIYEIDNYE